MRTVHRLAIRLLALVAAVTLPCTDARGGGLPAVVNLPAEWVQVTPGPGAEIVQFFQRLPHDPLILGVGPAHLRAGDYSAAFLPNRVTSADG